MCQKIRYEQGYDLLLDIASKLTVFKEQWAVENHVTSVYGVLWSTLIWIHNINMICSSNLKKPLKYITPRMISICYTIDLNSRDQGLFQSRIIDA